MLLLTKEELESYHDAKSCHICGKRTSEKLASKKEYKKFRDHCHYAGKY